MVRSAGVYTSAPPSPTMTVCVWVPGVVVVLAPGVVVVVVAPAAAWMLPERRCDPTSGAAVTYSRLVGPAGPPLPNDRPHSAPALCHYAVKPFSQPPNILHTLDS